LWHDATFAISANNGNTWADPSASVTTYYDEVHADTPVWWARFGDGGTAQDANSGSSTDKMQISAPGLPGYGPDAGLITGANTVAIDSLNVTYFEVRTATNGPKNVLGTGAWSVELWIAKYHDTPTAPMVLYMQALGAINSSGWPQIEIDYRYGSVTNTKKFEIRNMTIVNGERADRTADQHGARLDDDRHCRPVRQSAASRGRDL
jgi:hypothetical protein